MNITRGALKASLQSFHTAFSEEQSYIPRFRELLEAPRSFFRDHLPGHFTGSAFIINPSRSKTLLIHHAKLNKWLQPGGHADGDEHILNVALREAREETGLQEIIPMSEDFFDIDIHEIPSRADFPTHFHYDFRYLLMADEKLPFQINEESLDAKWVDLDSLELFSNESSLFRMRHKVQHLSLRADQH